MKKITNLGVRELNTEETLQYEGGRDETAYWFGFILGRITRDYHYGSAGNRSWGGF